MHISGKNSRLIFMQINEKNFNCSQSIDVINMLEGRCHSIELPLKLETIHMLSKQHWLLTERGTERKYLLSESPERVMEYTLQPIQEVWKKEIGQGLYKSIHMCSFHNDLVKYYLYKWSIPSCNSITIAIERLLSTKHSCE